MQGKFALKHLHLVHIVLNLHLISSKRAPAASDNDIFLPKPRTWSGYFWIGI